jgi:hypothetical protein
MREKNIENSAHVIKQRRLKGRQLSNGTTVPRHLYQTDGPFSNRCRAAKNMTQQEQVVLQCRNAQQACRLVYTSATCKLPVNTSATSC